MKTRVLLIVCALALLTVFTENHLATQPSFNGATPGCAGGGCHSLAEGIVSASATSLAVKITMTGNSGAVAAELVDSSGVVVATNNSTSSNPFTLTAPAPGLYRVNAGYKSPNRVWDSVMVRVITATAVGEERFPATLSLERNYPNPFNPVTVIEYRLPAASDVRLSVYDLLGREVAVLAQERTGAGVHRVSFDGSGFPSGMYVYRLQAGGVVLAGKCLLAK